MHNQRFSSLLYAIVEKNNISRKELADQIDMSQSSLSKLLSGSTEPKYSTIDKISRALKISPSLLFETEKDHFRNNTGREFFIKKEGVIDLILDDPDLELVVYNMFIYDPVKIHPVKAWGMPGEDRYICVTVLKGEIAFSQCDKYKDKIFRRGDILSFRKEHIKEDTTLNTNHAALHIAIYGDHKNLSEHLYSYLKGDY